MENKLILDKVGFYFLCVILPTVTVFHAAFSPNAEIFLLIFRAILLPIGAFFLIRKFGNSLLFMVFILFLLAFGFGEFATNTKDFLKHFLFLISFIIFFRTGYFAFILTNPQSLGTSLIISSILLNLCIVTFYTLVLFGVLDVADVYAIFEPERDPYLGAGRFSIGNAIEVPFMSAVLCFAATRIMPVTKTVVIAVMLNLFLAFVSESRIVIIISSFILFSIIFKSKNNVFLAVIIPLMLYVFFLYINEIFIILNSVFDRFLGNDAGSSTDRFFIYTAVFSWINEFNIIFGEGLTASKEKMGVVTGTYRTVEAFALELIYEIGLLGIVLFILILFKGAEKLIIMNTLRSLTLIFIWIQILFFLPLNPLTPLTAFCIGLAINKKDFNVRANKTRDVKYE